MKNHALYFMPDISGFTNFVTSTDIEHSRHIISELLEILIDSNIIGLKLVEIEGDALFMYTTENPSLDKIVEQSKKMLNNFHSHLTLYQTRRICNCGACSSVTNLKIKFVVHYGELSFIRVKDIVKPYGSDVIMTHRFLKNNIPSKQYLLLSKETIDFYKDQLSKDSLFEEKEEIFDFGKSYYFFLKFENPSEEPIELKKATLAKPKGKPQITLEVNIPSKINYVYRYVSDLKLRTTWNKLVKRLEFDKYRVNRIGTKHDCIVGLNRMKFETLGINDLENDTLVYGEKTNDAPFLKSNIHYIYLSKISENSTNLKLEVFLRFSFFGKVMQNMIINNISKLWIESLDNLSEV
jgi:hypothetical protein